MNQTLKNRIASLDARIAKAMRRKDYAIVQELQRRKREYQQNAIDMETVSLGESMACESEADRSRLTTRSIEVLVVCDLLQKYAMLLEKEARRFDIGVQMVTDIRAVIRKLGSLVRLIDDASKAMPGSAGNSFSDVYAEVVEAVETKFLGMENIVCTEVARRMKIVY